MQATAGRFVGQAILTHGAREGQRTVARARARIKCAPIETAVHSAVAYWRAAHLGTIVFHVAVLAVVERELDATIGGILTAGAIAVETLHNINI